ncbi:MAG: hypothetical protein ACREOU_10790 [Candidatus Eiseniibacteriota bacterium]
MVRAAVATARIARRPATLLALVLVTVTALALAGWWWAVQSAPRHSSRAATQTATLAIVNADQPTQAWPMIVPDQVADANDRPTPAPKLDPEPNWSALALGIADTGVPATAVHAVASGAAPADLEVPLSPAERGRLMAAAREPEAPPAPHGYVPGIVVYVPGGASSDGVCK